MTRGQNDELLQAVDRLFADLAVEHQEEGIEPSNASGWQQIEDHDVTSVLVPGVSGGFGGSWCDLQTVLHRAGLRVLALPIGETALVRGLLARASKAVPSGPLSFAASCNGDLTFERAGWRFSGALHAVPWGRRVSHVLFDAIKSGRRMRALVATADAKVVQRSNVSAEPRDDLRCIDVPVTVLEAKGEDLFTLGALLRSAQMGGALEFILELCIRFVGEREQFGRPLAQFQAIQHYIAILAEETAAVGCAAMAAARAAEVGEAHFEIAAAKLRANLAVAAATAIAHQCHGAIGTTKEYPLQRATRRLWAWRSEFGNDRYWAEWLGSAALQHGGSGLWALITERGDRTSRGTQAS